MATAASDATDVPLLKRGGAKKLIVIALGAVLLIGAGAGVAAYFLKQQQAKMLAELQADEEENPGGLPKRDPNVVPVFVPLEPFTVNLADRNADRFAQMTVALEVENAKVADRVRGFMPVIRNNMLLVLSRKGASDINHVEGKLRLSRELHIASLQAIGADTSALEAAAAASGAAPRKKQRREAAPPPPPILAVHFSTLIIQ